MRFKVLSKRSNQALKPNLEAVRETIENYKMDRVVVEGGDDTYSVALSLDEEYDVPVVGWLKTTDNDLSETHFYPGYPTAVKEAGGR